jgi:hypothetical protein
LRAMRVRGVGWSSARTNRVSDDAPCPQRPVRCSRRRPSRARSSPSNVHPDRSTKSADQARPASPPQAPLNAAARWRAWQASPSDGPSSRQALPMAPANRRCRAGSDIAPHSHRSAQVGLQQSRWLEALHRIDDELTFTARLSTGIVSHNRDGLVRRRMRLGRRQVVDADVRIYVQEVRAVHTAASDGGMRAAVRLPGMRRACPPCPPDRTRLPHHVGRNASGQRKVRAHHRRIARPGKIARSRMQLLRRPDFQDGQTCQGESVSASLTDLASRDPGNFP